MNDAPFTESEIRTYYTSRIPNLKWGNHREIRCGCPIHQGSDPNFSINTTTGLWLCHSQCGRGGDIIAMEQELLGCDFPTAKAEVYRTVGRDIPHTPKARGSEQGRQTAAKPSGAPAKPKGHDWPEVARYAYHAADGSIAYWAVRKQQPLPLPEGQDKPDKVFYLCRPDGRGGETRNLEGVERIPYNLPKLLAVEPGELILIAEGERKCDALAEWGLVATCAPGGSGGAKWWREWTPKYLAGKRVVILPDNDEPGRRAALAIAQSLLGATQ